MPIKLLWSIDGKPEFAINRSKWFMCTLTNSSMENNARCWNVAANCIVVRKSILFWSCARPIHQNRPYVPCICVYTCEKIHASLDRIYTSGNAIRCFNEIELKHDISTYRSPFSSVCTTRIYLIKPGSLYTNWSKIIPREAKLHIPWVS